MSLYYVSKLLYGLVRDPAMQAEFASAPDSVVRGYELSDEERAAILEPDIGLLYVMGVNCQILMHYAAMRGIDWADYLQRMRDGIKKHGPVRTGLYAMISSPDEKVVV